MIGSVFGSSTVHEVSMLISFLGNCEEINVRSDFIKICKKLIKIIKVFKKDADIHNRKGIKGIKNVY